MIKIISKTEIHNGAKYNLIGLSAMRVYKDGNITFSKQAGKLMDLKSKPYIEIGIDEDNEKVFLVPNTIQGYKTNQRQGKHTFLLNNKILVKFLKKVTKTEHQPRKALEFKISEHSKRAAKRKAFLITPVENN